MIFERDVGSKLGALNSAVTFVGDFQSVYPFGLSRSGVSRDYCPTRKAMVSRKGKVIHFEGDDGISVGIYDLKILISSQTKEKNKNISTRNIQDFLKTFHAQVFFVKRGHPSHLGPLH